ASSRPGRAARSSSAPSTGPPAAAVTVSAAYSVEAVRAEPATARASSSNAGADISSAVRPAGGPAKEAGSPEPAHIISTLHHEGCFHVLADGLSRRGGAARGGAYRRPASWRTR